MEDILHEVFIRFFRHAGSFNPEMNFSSWIYKITLNSCKNHIGSIKRTGEIIEREKKRLARTDNFYESPESSFIGEVDIEYFKSAVDSLKDKFKDVFILRYEENLKYSEICKILKCSERAAKWRVMRAVEIITDYLEKHKVV
jgi:RNA polymerase sigma-70 factor, ECF subfamily